ncbi:MAG: polymer-forming cytoskeletal protein [Nitrospinae bacterium]|nr:polymer-forming cytoskeletal protein [Nitrospinota bacterium]
MNNDKEINTFLSEGTSFQGKMNFKGIVRIDGKYNGEINSSDTLIVGEQALVKAKINVGNAIIYGTVEGDILSNVKIEMKKTAKVFGGIYTHSLDIENGAIFEGNCVMLDKKSEGKSTAELKRADAGENKSPETLMPEAGNANVINFDDIKEKAKKNVS